MKPYMDIQCSTYRLLRRLRQSDSYVSTDVVVQRLLDDFQQQQRRRYAPPMMWSVSGLGSAASRQWYCMSQHLRKKDRQRRE